MMPDILRQLTDGSLVVRKRARKILKDKYPRDIGANARSKISGSLLYRTADLDQTVREVACQSIEEIWILPHLLASTRKVSLRTTLSIASNVFLIAKVI